MNKRTRRWMLLLKHIRSTGVVLYIGVDGKEKLFTRIMCNIMMI